VIAFRVGMDEPIADAGTDDLGNYVLEIPYGEYHVRACAEGYIPEWYDNAQHREEATVLVVNQEHNPDGIVFLLAPYEHEFGTISGTIFGETPDGEQPLPFAHVIAFRVGMDEPIADAGTDDLGNYVLEVPYGEYHVRAGAEGYIPEWYDNAQHREGATVLVVNQEHNPDGIVFLLEQEDSGFGTISGTVYGETERDILSPFDGEVPLPFAHVIAFRVGMEEPVADATTDELGNYVLEVPYGEYHVRAAAEGYIPEWYDNAQHREEATVLVVNEESNPDGIIFVLTPLTTAISQNYPNPFNIHTMVSFTLAKPGDVELIIYNIYGQRVTILVDGFCQAGIHELIWDGRNVNGNLVASGVYYYRLKVGDKSETRRMTLLK
jgi:hypothetical protein